MYGVAAGSATAFSLRFSNKEEIERLMKETYKLQNYIESLIKYRR